MTVPWAEGRVPRVRVAVADDDELIRRTMAALVEYEDDLVLAGVAEHTAGALHAARDADVLVADVRMPGGGAAEAARRLREQGSHATVVALTGHQSAADRERLREAGVAACLLKGCPIDDIVETIRTAAAATQASRSGSSRFFTRSSTDGRESDASDRLESSA